MRQPKWTIFLKQKGKKRQFIAHLLEPAWPRRSARFPFVHFRWTQRHRVAFIRWPQVTLLSRGLGAADSSEDRL